MTYRLHHHVAPWLIALLIGLLLALSLHPGPASAAGRVKQQSGAVSGTYIVSFRGGVEAQGKTAALVARAAGGPGGKFAVRHVYSAALHGFAASLSDEQVAMLLADPDVASVTPDYVLSVTADSLPAGLKRIEANRNAVARMGSGQSVDVDVAIIDSGIDLDHPDLNVAGGVNCAPNETTYDDGNGHGTHVAGTVGAKDNGIGVIGVAPGARLWAVRVFDASGQADFADVICGVDWVTAHAATIEIANMSLGGLAPEGTCSDGSLHQAICASVTAGVTYVVAAGNDGANASDYVPASYDEVITVSAIVDTDGKPGGTGTSSYFYGNDDTLALFSNYGADVDIAAPGYSIYSTWMGGSYRYENGTSMAAPHVAGAAALYKVTNPSATPAQVRSQIIGTGWPYGSMGGFTGDRDAFHENMLNVAAVSGDPIQPECTLNPADASPGMSISASCLFFGPSEFLKVFFDSTSSIQRGIIMVSPTGAGSGSFMLPDMPIGPHPAIFVGSTSGYQTTGTLTIVPSFKIVGASSGRPGVYVLFQARGFGAGETVNIDWFGADGTPVTVKSAVTSATGQVMSSFVVPEAAAGTYTVTATGATSGGTSETAFTVTPYLTLSLPIGKVGASVTANLKGYAAGETVEVRWYDDASNYTVLGSTTVSSLGSGSVAFAVPAAVNGQHKVEGVGSEGSLSSATYNVQPAAVVAPYSGPAGTTITINLSGYRGGETINIRWYSTISAYTVITSVVASDTGSAQVTFAAPESVNGFHKVEAVGASSNALGSGSFIITAGMTMTPTSGPSGTSVQVAGTGYRPGETVTLRWYTTTYSSVIVGTGIASSSGSVAFTFNVPAGATLGGHKVEAAGGTSGARASATFTVN